MKVVQCLVPLLLMPTIVGSLASQDVGQAREPAARAVPHFGSGIVWVEPLPLPPREMVSRLTGISKDALADSLVDRIMSEYLRALAKEAALTPTLPDWTGNVAGQTVGLDTRWIYLGPIKVPTALLALIPMNIGSNPMERDKWRALADMLWQIRVAGRRSAILDEIVESAKQVREYHEAEREFLVNQRTPPPKLETPD
jgi:hypothetical protein